MIRSLIVAFALGACHREAAPVEPRSLIEIARACLVATGDGMRPISWTEAVIEPDGDWRWRVCFSGAPAAVVIDTALNECGGRANGPAVSATFAQAQLDYRVAVARHCARDRASPLELDHLRVTYRVESGRPVWGVSFPEVNPGPLPSGLDLIVDAASASCTRALMD